MIFMFIYCDFAWHITCTVHKAIYKNNKTENMIATIFTTACHKWTTYMRPMFVGIWLRCLSGKKKRFAAFYVHMYIIIQL